MLLMLLAAAEEVLAPAEDDGVGGAMNGGKPAGKPGKPGGGKPGGKPNGNWGILASSSSA